MRCGRGRKVDDPPAVRHPLRRLLAAEERPLDVDGEKAVELLLRDLRQRLVEHHTGVVHQDVEPAELLEAWRRTAAPRPPTLLTSACTAMARPPAFSMPADGLLGLLLAARVVDDDRGTVPAQPLGDGPPDAPGWPR